MTVDTACETYEPAMEFAKRPQRMGMLSMDAAESVDSLWAMMMRSHTVDMIPNSMIKCEALGNEHFSLQVAAMT